MTTELTCTQLAPRHAEALAELFDRNKSPCYCRYWHFEGDKNSWLDRCANQPEASRAELVLSESSQDADELRGVVAEEAAGAIRGWMKLTRASAVPKLYAQRLYRGLPCFEGDRTHVFTIGCFLIDEPLRRTGIAQRLLTAGIQLARDAGAEAIEAFPRRVDNVPAEQLWTGPAELYDAHGFALVNDFAPYPVLRYTIDR